MNATARIVRKPRPMALIRGGSLPLAEDEDAQYIGVTTNYVELWL